MEKAEVYFTLITGASSGIGKAMAVELAKKKRNLFLIALPETGLVFQSEEICLKYEVKTRFLEIDLLDQQAPEKIMSFARNENLKINMLINNIGVGHVGFLGEFSVQEIDEMMMLNVYFNTRLTNLLLKELKSYPESFILNMGSLGGYTPAPNKSIYMATKAFIYFLSRGMDLELENTSVKVCVAMPGPVRSNQKMVNRINNDGSISKSMSLNPDEVAKFIIPRFLRGEKIIIPGKMTKAVFLLGNILPYGFIRYTMKKIFREKN